jgi:hypothetical protein
MTVSELIESLKALPGDMPVAVVISDGDGGPDDIVRISRGTWASDIALEKYSDGEDVEFPEEDEFVLDDESGKIAVLVTW